VIIGVAFGLAWYKGYVARIRNYWNLTVEELRKCAWPTWDELKGSTVVVSITIALLGAFCCAVDFVFFHLVRAITL
jgi:preprotein translocase subunit SecE